MEDTNNTIFTHAKMEYTSQLIDNITPQIFDGISSIYEESKTYQKLHLDKSIVINNALGKLGALIAHQFIYLWFGIFLSAGISINS